VRENAREDIMEPRERLDAALLCGKLGWPTSLLLVARPLLDDGVAHDTMQRRADRSRRAVHETVLFPHAPLRFATFSWSNPAIQYVV
jgi:hypothetical protein